MRKKQLFAGKDFVAAETVYWHGMNPVDMFSVNTSLVTITYIPQVYALVGRNVGAAFEQHASESD